MQRGLYERTLVVAMGEFGRTPRMNANAGRDHWGQTFSVLFGNGRMSMGQVIGRSSRAANTSSIVRSRRRMSPRRCITIWASTGTPNRSSIIWAGQSP